MPQDHVIPRQHYTLVCPLVAVIRFLELDVFPDAVVSKRRIWLRRGYFPVGYCEGLNVTA